MLQRKNHEYTPSEPLNDGTPPAVFTVVGSGAKLEGTFEVADSIQIECEVGGQLKVGKRLVIGEQGSLRADVETVDAIIHGQYKGNMVATGSVEITPTGRVAGKIETDSLVISKGGFFNGRTVKLKESQAEGDTSVQERPKRAGLGAEKSREGRSAHREADVSHVAEDLGLSLDGGGEIPSLQVNDGEDAKPVEPRAATPTRRSRAQAASRGGRKKKAKTKRDHGRPVTPKPSEAEPLPPLPSRGEPLADDVDLGGGPRLQEDRLMMRLGLAPGKAGEIGSALRGADEDAHEETPSRQANDRGDTELADPLTRRPKRRARAQAASRGGRKKKAKTKRDHGRVVTSKASDGEAHVTPASGIDDMAEFLPPLPSGGALLSEDLDLDAGPPSEEQGGWPDMDLGKNEPRGSSFWEEDDLADDSGTRGADWESDPAPLPDEDPLGIR
ncbi:MAG: polymer-forming cytoskeletal protein [Candidatus Methylomirabilales bacterium]